MKNSLVILMLLFFLDVSCQTIAVIGDYGNSYIGENLSQVSDLVDSWSPDAIITTGDNNYPDGEAETIDDNIGQFFSNYIFPYSGSYASNATENKFFPSLGNHDYQNPQGAQPYLDYLELPGNERYYDVVVGDVHLFSVNSVSQEIDGVEANSVQAEWLQNALANSTSVWKLVYFHHPPYSSGFPNDFMKWPFEEWGATAVISGDEHFYEMSSVDCFPYFVNGIGGPGVDSSAPSGSEYTEAILAGVSGAMKIVADSESIKFELWTVENELFHSYVIASDENPNHLFRCKEEVGGLPKIPSEVRFHNMNNDLLKEVIYKTENSIQCIKNCGNGVYEAPFSIKEFSSEFSLVSMADLDQDGRPDFIIKSPSEGIILLEGFGIAQAAEGSIVSAESDLEIEFTDFNGNGNIDLILTNLSEGIIYLVENLGDFEFSAPIEIVNLQGSGFFQVLVSDITEDGLADLTFIIENGEVGFFENLNNGNVGELQLIHTFESVVFHSKNQWLDVNQDGQLELLLSYENVVSNTHEVSYLSSSVEDFSLVTVYSVEASSASNFWLKPNIHDIDEDGDLDILLEQNNSLGNISLLELENGLLASVEIFNTGFQNKFIIADLDGDDSVELIIAEDLLGGRLLRYKLVSGQVEEPELLMHLGLLYFQNMVFFNDLDNDTDQDMLITTFGNPPTNFLYTNQLFNSAEGIQGDFDLDGAVSSTDLTLFLTAFGSDCNGCNPDMNNDGLVGSADLTIFLALFGSCAVQ